LGGHQINWPEKELNPAVRVHSESFEFFLKGMHYGKISEGGPEWWPNRKDFGAEKLQALAGATREYASSIGDLPNLRTHVSSAAESIDGLAEYVMHTDVEHILEDAGTFARRNPLTTLGVSVAAGLAASLLMRPSRSTSKPASKSKARSKARKQPAKHQRRANGTTQAHA
jgi:hypothetical protein